MRTITISNSELLEAQAALAALSAGYPVTVDGKTTSRSYKFPTLVLLAIAAAEVRIKPAAKAFQKANQALFRSYDPVPVQVAEDKPEELRVPPERFLAYQEETDALFSAMVEIHVPSLTLANLNVGDEKSQNPIPAAVVASLAPILMDGFAGLEPDQGEEA